MAFKLPILRDLPPQITIDLPSFQYKDIENERPIAKGGFGFVSKANYQNKTVVIKKITSESSEDEKLFLKEAKLIDSLRHANVVGFIPFCTLPYTLMLEYVAFDFSHFGHSKLITNLGDFLNYLDRIDGFKVFDDRLHGKIFSDIAAGLAYLHEKDIAHRGLFNTDFCTLIHK